jgi:hypothetical protein
MHVEQADALSDPRLRGDGLPTSKGRRGDRQILFRNNLGQTKNARIPQRFLKCLLKNGPLGALPVCQLATCTQDSALAPPLVFNRHGSNLALSDARGMLYESAQHSPAVSP